MEELRDARGMTEAEAIARYRSRNYPKPALTADIVVLARAGEGLKVLLIRRKGHPFIGKLALPGGFANENEPVEQTATRELEEETGVTGLELKKTVAVEGDVVAAVAVVSTDVESRLVLVVALGKCEVLTVARASVNCCSLAKLLRSNVEDVACGSLTVSNHILPCLGIGSVLCLVISLADRAA